MHECQYPDIPSLYRIFLFCLKLLHKIFLLNWIKKKLKKSEIIISTYTCYCFDTGVFLIFLSRSQDSIIYSFASNKISQLRVEIFRKISKEFIKDISSFSAIRHYIISLTIVKFCGTLNLLKMVSRMFYYHKVRNFRVTKSIQNI